MKTVFRIVLAVIQAGIMASAQEASAPQGWTVSKSDANWVYAPRQLPANEIFSLTIEPAEALGTQNLTGFLNVHAQAEQIRRGLPASPITPQRSQDGALIALAPYRDPRGTNWVTMYIAATRPDGKVQFGYAQSNMRVSLASPYFRVAGTIFRTALSNTNPSAHPPALGSDQTRVEPHREEGGHPVAPSQSSLPGLYMRGQFQMMLGMGGRYDYYFYLFSPDGRVYEGCPANGKLDRFDFAAAAISEPAKTGTYSVNGDRIEFVWGAGRKPESSPLRFTSDEVVFLGEHWTHPETGAGIKNPPWLIGAFRYQIGGSVGGVSGISQNWYTFHSDGTFESAGSSAALTNAPVPQANRSHAIQASGRYDLNGTTLSLRYADGHTVQRTVFRYGQAIFIDCTLFIRPK